MRPADVMRRLIPPASYVLFLFFLTGIWVVMSPFVMQTQAAGVHWSASTINNVVLGGILIVVSLLGILGYMIFALRDMLQDTATVRIAAQQTAE